MRNPLFKKFPTSQTHASSVRQNLNDIVGIDSTVTIDDVQFMLAREIYDMPQNELDTYIKTGKLPTDVYVVFVVNVGKEGEVETLNVQTATIYGMMVNTVGDEYVDLGKYLRHTKAGVYNADSDVDETIDLENINEIVVKAFNPVFETRPSVMEFRIASTLFKKDIHYVNDSKNPGEFVHHKYASKDHEGFGQMYAESQDTGVNVNYIEVAKKPVLTGANPLRTPVISVNFQ